MLNRQLSELATGNKSVARLIAFADTGGWCTDWQCGTCAASRLRRGLEKLLGCSQSYPGYSEADMEQLARMLSELSEVRDSGAAEALLLLVSRMIGYERTAFILGNTPAGSHYELMWQSHLEAEKRRETHRSRMLRKV